MSLRAIHGNAARLAWRLVRRARMSSLARGIASQWPFPMLTDVEGSRPIYVDLRSSIGRGIFATGQFDIEAIRPALDSLTPGAVFFDVGANIGYYSFLALDRVREDGVVYSFECNPQPLNAFKRTIRLHKPRNLFLENVAVWNHDGEIAFTIERESGHSHVTPSNSSGVSVRCRSLDSWAREHSVGRVDIIKIDVEGCELQVLEGAVQLIKACRPLIVCELDPVLTRRFGYEPARLTEMLEAMHYRIESLRGAFSPTIVARYRS